MHPAVRINRCIGLLIFTALAIRADSPTIVVFSVTPASIFVGQSAVLSFQVLDAQQVTISGIGNVAPSGTVKVTPTTTTLYTLTAFSSTGEVSSASITVNVFMGSPPPISVESSYLWFYDQTLGDETRQNFTIDAIVPIDVQLTILPDIGTPSGSFAIEGASSFRVSRTRNVVVLFKPIQAGKATATLDVSGGGYTVSVRLVANGVNRGSITVLGFRSIADGSEHAAPDNWISILGRNLSTETHEWSGQDLQAGTLPIKLGGVSVTINGKPAYIAYVSPKQINVLLPVIVDDAFNYNLVITNETGNSNPSPVQWRPWDPKLLSWASADESRRYVIAVLPDGAYAGHSGLLADVATRPVVAGERVTVYLTGLGPRVQDFQQGKLSIGILPQTLTFNVGTIPVIADYLALISPGLYQAAFVVPDRLTGDLPLSFNFQSMIWEGSTVLTVGSSN